MNYRIAFISGVFAAGILLNALPHCAAGETAGDATLTVKTYELADILYQDYFKAPKKPAPKVAGKGAVASEPQAGPPTLAVLADLLKLSVRPEKWDPALGTSVTEKGTQLSIKQTNYMHGQIAAFIALLREAGGTAGKIAIPGAGKPGNADNRTDGLEIRIYNVPLATKLELTKFPRDVEPQSWADPGATSHYYACKTGYVLIVQQSAEVHEQIKAELGKAK